MKEDCFWGSVIKGKMFLIYLYLYKDITVIGASVQINNKNNNGVLKDTNSDIMDRKNIENVPSSMTSPPPKFTSITSVFLSEYFVLRHPDLNNATGS